jgi:hypothetical protein
LLPLVDSVQTVPRGVGTGRCLADEEMNAWEVGSHGSDQGSRRAYSYLEVMKDLQGFKTGTSILPRSLVASVQSEMQADAGFSALSTAIGALRVYPQTICYETRQDSASC